VHVLYLIDSLVPGGSERSLAEMAPGLTGSGLTLDVGYLRDRPGLQGDLRRADATLFCLDGGGGATGRLGRIRRLIRARRPDLVHTTLFEADVLGRLGARSQGVPVVSSLVSVPYGPEQLADPRLKPWKVRAARLIDATTARFAIRFHAVTSYVADVMAARLHVPRSRIDVIHRGRDANRLGRCSSERRTAARSSLGITSTSPLILAVARHEYAKGLDVLLRAFAEVSRRHPGAHLGIAGREGNETPLLRSLISDLGLEDGVLILGVRNDVPELICASDVVAVPSRWEGIPNVVLEALALESPIVASDLPAVREVIGDEEALLVPIGDPEALAAAVLASLSDPIGPQRRVAAGRSRFLERFTVDRVAEAMVRFYQQALSQDRDAR
jgi:glycosyltransferase involved in cell wall biosynthesis